MGLDTRSKRASALNFGTPFWVVLPEPDGNVDVDDRAHTLHMYAGGKFKEPPKSTGGWYDFEIRETEEEKRRQREKLGITKPDKKAEKPTKITYLREIDRIEQISDANEIDNEIQQLIIKVEEAEARQADLDTLLRIHLYLAAAEERARQIEEQDIVFVMAMLTVMK